MHHHRLPLAPPQPRDFGPDDDFDPPLAQIDQIQLRRLATTVLSKSPDDLAALAETNPMLVWEWIDSFRKLRLEAEAEARYWSAAMAALSTASPDPGVAPRSNHRHVSDKTTMGLDIVRWDQLTGRADLLPAIDGIFFEASATKTFASDEARLAFRERWLGRYLTHFPQHAFLASHPPGPCAAMSSAASRIRRGSSCSAISRISAPFRTLTSQYPAQLHINIASDWRSQGSARVSWRRSARRLARPAHRACTS